MSKSIKTFDLLSVLFGASIVILAISIYMVTATITKKSISNKEMAKLYDMEVSYLHQRIDNLEQTSQEKYHFDEDGQVKQRVENILNMALGQIELELKRELTGDR